MQSPAFLMAAAALACTVATAAPVDLTTWAAESYPAVAGLPAGVWTVDAGGARVTQSENGQPTFFFSDFNAFGTTITGTIRTGGSDDDFIGFALGYRPGDAGNAAADYLLIDWKKAAQFTDFGSPSASAGATAAAGLAVSRVTGRPDADEFWQHANLAGTGAGSGLQELARGATLGSVGWVDGVDYAFTFSFGPNDLEVFVDGVKQLDITGSFGNGRVAFYNFSQAGVSYSAFDVDPGPFPNAVPEPASAAMVLLALAGLLAGGRRLQAGGCIAFLLRRASATASTAITSFTSARSISAKASV